MIEVKNVTKTFDGHTALNGLTMTVPTGAVYGLVGPNGSGKSTIIRHIMGIYRQDSGEVLIDGKKPSPETKAVVSYLPERNALPLWMTTVSAPSRPAAHRDFWIYPMLLVLFSSSVLDSEMK